MGPRGRARLRRIVQVAVYTTKEIHVDQCSEHAWKIAKDPAKRVSEVDPAHEIVPIIGVPIFKMPFP